MYAMAPKTAATAETRPDCAPSGTAALAAPEGDVPELEVVGFSSPPLLPAVVPVADALVVAALYDGNGQLDGGFDILQAE